ncbi:hypothetical protein B0H14DRAFT_2612410 [Mycena olivaceomarginata]|nr:hypothetical protein B0H14DRAFT_2612410 [Mycena olivaceomarginata]
MSGSIVQITSVDAGIKFLRKQQKKLKKSIRPNFDATQAQEEEDADLFRLVEVQATYDLTLTGHNSPSQEVSLTGCHPPLPAIPPPVSFLVRIHPPIAHEFTRLLMSFQIWQPPQI